MIKGTLFHVMISEMSISCEERTVYVICDEPIWHIKDWLISKGKSGIRVSQFNHISN